MLGLKLNHVSKRGHWTTDSLSSLLLKSMNIAVTRLSATMASNIQENWSLFSTTTVCNYFAPSKYWEKLEERMYLPSNIIYNTHLIPKLKRFLSRLATVVLLWRHVFSWEWRCSWSSADRSDQQICCLLRCHLLEIWRYMFPETNISTLVQVNALVTGNAKTSFILCIAQCITCIFWNAMRGL